MYFLFNFGYTFGSLFYFLNSSILIIIHIIYTNRTSITSSCRETTIMVKKVAFAFVINDTWMSSKTVRYIFLNNALIVPWASYTCCSTILYHLWLSSCTCINQIV